MSNTQVKDMAGTRTGGPAPQAGAVWGSRMRVDQVKAGTKISNPTHNSAKELTTSSRGSSSTNNKMRPKQSPTKKSPVQIKKTSDVNEISSVKLRKVKSALSDRKTEAVPELRKVKSETSKNLDGNLKNSLSLLLVEAKTEEETESIDECTETCYDKKVVEEPNEDLEGPVWIDKSRSDEDCEEFGSDNLDQNQIMKSQPNLEEEEEEEDDDDDEEVDEDLMEVEVEVEKKILEIKEINVNVEEEKEKKLINEKLEPISSTVKQEAANYVRNYPKTEPISDHFHGSLSGQSKLQSFVDLIMWRDVSKSAFIFGIGSFAIISSSYTKDINISLISVLSYLGLAYLAANFLLKSLITRGVENTKQDYVVGEQEAVWVIKLILPYLNEFLLKLRGLFSGDPATTLKLAVLLFILARCGSSITICKMAKLGFFGVFTVPKVCSAYSSQLNAYGTFWIRRFGDAWESCSHKKAVGFGIFTLIWNMCSVVARIWAVFILFVAFKYYRQSWIREESVQEEATIENYMGRRQQNPRSTIINMRKQKKVC